ncbi:helix-turn-helix domain-containing protein [Chitinophaga sp. Hz27]|uniref:helix-turn-helix domain-containing protein n=1 Tax=Chitinophaga sp. Hz27 TaxID=3347169 RepID=UPI0035D97322
MDKRIKYSSSQKLIIVKAVISGKESCCSAAVKIGTTDTVILRWVNLYRHHGGAVFDRSAGRYSGQFKVRVIQYMLKKQLSLTQTAAFFGVPQDCTVGLWLKKYKELGANGLLVETRGRKSIMAKKGKNKVVKSTTDAEAKLLALQKENEYLRAENAFLKKLDALIQEEKQATTGLKSQK